MPWSEGVRGMRPRRMRERFSQLGDKDRDEFLFRLVTLLLTAFLALVIAAAAAAVLFWSIIDTRDERRRLTDQKLLNLACLALRYTPPSSSFHHDLEAQYPHCPEYRPAPRPAPSTRTVRPKAAKPSVPHADIRTTPRLTVPASEPIRTAVAPRATSTGQSQPTSTPAMPHATVRAVATHGGDTGPPTQTGPSALLPTLLCPAGPGVPLVYVLVTC